MKLTWMVFSIFIIKIIFSNFAVSNMINDHESSKTSIAKKDRPIGLPVPEPEEPTPSPSPKPKSNHQR